MPEKSTKEHLNGLEQTLDLYFAKKAPALPKGGKEFIVKVAPWLVIIGCVISLPGILTLFGIGSEASNVMMHTVGYGLGPVYYVSIILLIGVIVLELLALPGLFNRKKAGWNYVFYATLVSLLSNLIVLNLLGFVVGALISFYFLFQVREYYK